MIRIYVSLHLIMSYTIAIVGRPNVGKSTFFNRMMSERRAIVDDEPGVTRDRQYGECEWNGKSFFLIDTGGLVLDSEEGFDKEIRRQVHIAMEEAHAIIFMVDAKDGVTPLEEEIMRLLHTIPKPIFVVVNKVDNHERLDQSQEFYSLGVETLYPLSSINGSGTGEILDALVKDIPEQKVKEEEKTIPKIAIIGQPNAGKSSLLNILVGEERVIVNAEPGTTRDPIHTYYNLFQKEFLLIDTAGIRKKNKEKENVEFYAIIRAVKAIEESDICLLLIDATKGITQQDLSIFSLAVRKGKGIVLLINKWDLIDKNTKTAKEYEEVILHKIAPLKDIPILFVSVKDKTRIFKSIEVALQVYENKTKRISTSQLNDMMLKVIEQSNAPMVRGHSIKIKYITQVNASLPAFCFFTNFPNDVPQSYRNFLENQLRKHFLFKGVPVRIFFKRK